MDKYQETSATWNKIAELYQQKFMDLDLYNATYDYFCDQLDLNQSRILEIGCGPGNITRYLLNRRLDFQIFGIDIALNMVTLAEKNNPEATFMVMDCRDIDQVERTFDGIVCGFCLPYLSATDRLKFIKDCSALLFKGGFLYLSYVEGPYEDSDYKTGSSDDRVYFYFHELENMEEEFAQYSLEVKAVLDVDYKRSETVSETHRILIIKKLE